MSLLVSFVIVQDGVLEARIPHLSSTGVESPLKRLDS